MRLNRLDVEKLEELDAYEKIHKRKPLIEETAKVKYFKKHSCTDKKRFRTNEEASDYIKMLERVFNKNGESERFTKLRAYPCPICQGIHLTSCRNELWEISGDKPDESEK